MKEANHRKMSEKLLKSFPSVVVSSFTDLFIPVQGDIFAFVSVWYEVVVL